MPRRPKPEDQPRADQGARFFNELREEYKHDPEAKDWIIANSGTLVRVFQTNCVLTERQLHRIRAAEVEMFPNDQVGRLTASAC